MLRFNTWGVRHLLSSISLWNGLKAWPISLKRGLFVYDFRCLLKWHALSQRLSHCEIRALHTGRFFRHFFVVLIIGCLRYPSTYPIFHLVRDQDRELPFSCISVGTILYLITFTWVIKLTLLPVEARDLARLRSDRWDLKFARDLVP